MGTELEWLALVRHGESTGNVAALKAETDGLEVIDIPERDADVPLSETGFEQAGAVGRWLRGLPRPPDLAVVSPYLRAWQTAATALDGSGIELVVDERLRDRELGILDLLTRRGVNARLPEEAVRRDRLGKFYYRPPGGESWADVVLRLRSLLTDLRQHHAGHRLVLFTHEAPVLLIRYLVEGLSEEQLLRVARANAMANCSISSWQRDADGLLCAAGFNQTDHLHAHGVEPTAQEEVRAEPT